jgi:hypothetical protein
MSEDQDKILLFVSRFLAVYISVVRLSVSCYYVRNRNIAAVYSCVHMVLAINTTYFPKYHYKIVSLNDTFCSVCEGRTDLCILHNFNTILSSTPGPKSFLSAGE